MLAERRLAERYLYRYSCTTNLIVLKPGYLYNCTFTYLLHNKNIPTTSCLLYSTPTYLGTYFTAEELELGNYPISVIQERPAVFFTGNVKHSKSPVHFFSFRRFLNRPPPLPRYLRSGQSNVSRVSWEFLTNLMRSAE